jgi:hypothetical protein
MFIEPGSNVNRPKAVFASTDADAFDPACDDDAIPTAKYCGQQQQQQQVAMQKPAATAATFMDAASSKATGTLPGPSPITGLLDTGLQQQPAGNASNLACTQGFTKVRVGLWRNCFMPYSLCAPGYWVWCES